MIHPLLEDRRGLLLYLAVWLLLGVVLALPAVGLEVARWPTALLAFVPPFMLFSSLCLTAWYPCRANPLGSTSALRLVAVHVSAGLVSSLVWFALATIWASRVPLANGAPAPPSPELPRYLALGMLFYLLAATLHYLMLAFEESRQAQERALELRVLAREAELAAYKSQIDPHFLFNCLKSISSLCGSRQHRERGRAMRLGEFLRASLRMADRELIPLAEEVELALGYLEIERTRFGDRLVIESVIEDDALDFPVPSLLLQPLLENAVKHGLANLVEGGVVSLAARRVGPRLRIEVANPVDPDQTAPRGEGIGLDNVVGRLELLYRGTAQLEVHRAADAFRVTIELPEPSASDRRGGPRPRSR